MGRNQADVLRDMLNTLAVETLRLFAHTGEDTQVFQQRFASLNEEFDGIAASRQQQGVATLPPKFTPPPVVESTETGVDQDGNHVE